MPFCLQTHNHHLFLVLKLQNGEDIIALLGKRGPHFPYYGARFENATFYNLTRPELHHHSEEEMSTLRFEMGKTWRISGTKPLDFELQLTPSFLKKRKIFIKKMFPLKSSFIPGAIFRYHTFSSIGGRIGQNRIQTGHGFSEQGILSILTPKVWQVVFSYQLLIKKDAGSLQWRAIPQEGKNFFEKIPQWIKKYFLKDSFHWGNETPPDNFETVATTTLPLPAWELKREIVKPTDPTFKEWFGLKEGFSKAVLHKK